MRTLIFRLIQRAELRRLVILYIKILRELIRLKLIQNNLNGTVTLKLHRIKIYGTKHHLDQYYMSLFWLKM